MKPTKIPFRTRRLASRGACLLVMLASVTTHAAVITIGAEPSCTRPTIQAAIDHAANLGGHHTLHVSDDGDPDRVRRENLTLPNMSVDIIGGFAHCTSTLPTGRTTISGAEQQAPVVRIDGNGTVVLRRLVLRDGTSDPLTTSAGGIHAEGHGTLILSETSVIFNEGFGVELNALGGDSLLDLSGGVSLSNNVGGVRALNRGRVRIHSVGNEIASNRGNGIVLLGGSSVDVASAGAVIRDNVGVGIAIVGYGNYPGRGSRLDSSNPLNPLGIVGNRAGAIAMESMDELTWLCTRNLRIDDNGTSTQAGTTVSVSGNAYLEMNTPCNWSPAVQVCASGRGGCNSVSGNTAANGRPVFLATEGGSIAADRLWFEENSGTSLLSTNPGMTDGVASIVGTNLAIIDNVLQGAVAESRNGAHVQIRASTIRGSTGSETFAGTQPGALLAIDTIVERTQRLLLSDTPSRTRLRNILSPHRVGAGTGDLIVVGAVQFDAGSICLQSGALGIDHASTEATALDIFGAAREVDMPDVPNVGGARDIGACERGHLNVDRIFLDGFESAQH